jgi:nucleoside-diphosphate-sugar epimerase
MEWRQESIIVYGGSGFLGGGIVRRLVELGCRRVVCFSRRPAPELQRLGAEVIRGDIRSRRAVVNAAKGCTGIIHTAAKAGIWGPRSEYYAINVTGTENVLAACAAHGISPLVYTSSPSVAYSPTGHVENIDEHEPYPDHYLANYPETKAIAEKKVLGEPNKNLSAAAIRPHLIWGPGDPHLLPRVILRAASGKLKILGDGHNLVDMTYIDNAIEAHIKAFEFLRQSKPPVRKVYFVSDDAPVEIWQWLNSLLAKLNISPVTKNIPFKKAYIAAGIIEAVFKFLPLAEPPITRFAVGQLAYSHYFNISAAKNELGYKPVISHDKALSRTIEWLQRSVEI